MSYLENRKKLAKYAASLTKNPMVLFRASCQSWGSDSLTATIKNSSGKYFILGEYNGFPGWDPSYKDDFDWEEATDSVEEFINRMNSKAENFVPSENSTDEENLVRPSFSKKTNRDKKVYVEWDSQKGRFHRISMCMDFPEIIAPDEEFLNIKNEIKKVDLENKINKKLHTLKSERERLQKLEASIERMNEEINSLRQELSELEY